MDHLFNVGEEVAFRVGYDDVNESLCCRPLVHATLALLGASSEQVRHGEPNGAFEGLTRLGFPPAGEADADARTAERFEPQRAANFWSSQARLLHARPAAALEPWPTPFFRCMHPLSFPLYCSI